MKKTPLKRKSSLRTTYKAKIIKEDKLFSTRPTARQGGDLKRGRKIRAAGKSEPAVLKREIQALLREGVMARDGGCFLRHFKDRITPQYRECGPIKNNGELILQAEHLHSRSNMSSFADLRLVVCCCQRHHFYYKPQHSAEYNAFAREFIGPERSKLWDRVTADHRPYKADLKLLKIALERDVARLKSK